MLFTYKFICKLFIGYSHYNKLIMHYVFIYFLKKNIYILAAV